MHPSDEIRAAINTYLEGSKILIGVTGSVAIYKTIDAARELLRRGARVKVVMTEEAKRYVGEDLFYWATGEKPITTLTGRTEHVEIVREYDSMIIAPATLSTIAKISHGIADNPVALFALSAIGYEKPLLIVPAMHENLYRTPQMREALSKLESIKGVAIIPPLIEGSVAKYPDPRLVARVSAALTRRGSRDLEGRRFLVTAGPTREWLDKVRFLSNPSSGRMGVEIALEAWARGAEVDLVHGPTSWVPHVVKSYMVETTEEMASVVKELSESTHYDAVVAAAAPVDFRPSRRFEGKIRSGRTISIEFEPTPKVVASLARRPGVLVVFAAEYVYNLEDLTPMVKEKEKKYGADIVVGNIVGVKGVGFSAEEIAALVMSRGRRIFKGTTHKEILASIVVDEVSKILSA